MPLSSQVGTGSEEQDFAGSVDSSSVISCTEVGSSSVSGGTSVGMMTGAAAAAVDSRILATPSTKNLAKPVGGSSSNRLLRPHLPAIGQDFLIDSPWPRLPSHYSVTTHP